MWLAKFKIKHDCFILSKIKRKKLRVLAYVLGVHEDGDSLYYTTFITPVGEEKEIARFLEQMRKDPQVLQLNQVNNQIITLTKVARSHKHVSSNFSHELFLVEPILHERGFEYWHLASWNRERLISFYQRTRELGSIEILKLEEEKNYDIFYPRLMPQLTVQQKNAFNLALENGYYDYPQKIHLEELAALMKVSRMTYREHLKKAQSRLLPFFANSMRR